MGLDMYLTGKRYISKVFDEKAFEEINNVDIGQEDFKINEVSIDVGYWRKQNQIHHWFVENVQDGVDDCRIYHVERDKLKELRDLCQDVINEPDKASDLLPAQGGFFFGGVEYDDYYMEGLQDTINIIDKALTLSDAKWEIYYQSSW